MEVEEEEVEEEEEDEEDKKTRERKRERWKGRSLEIENGVAQMKGRKPEEQRRMVEWIIETGMKTGWQ